MTQGADHFPEIAATDLSVADVGRLWWRARWLIVSAGLLGIVIAAAIALAIRPTFRASVVVAEAEAANDGALDSLASQFGGLASLGGINLKPSMNLDQTLAVLQSVPFTLQFIADQNAMPVLFASESRDGGAVADGQPDSSRGSGVLAAIPESLRNMAGFGTPTAEESRRLRQWEAFKRFDRGRFVDRDRKTQIVTISVDARDPDVAARWANGLVDMANAELRARAITEAQARITFLEKRLESADALEMRQALFRLIEAEQRRALVANTRSEFALRVLSRALPPAVRVSPHRTLMALMGGMGGSLLAALWLVVVGKLGPRSAQPA